MWCFKAFWPHYFIPQHWLLIRRLLVTFIILSILTTPLLVMPSKNKTVRRLPTKFRMCHLHPHLFDLIGLWVTCLWSNAGWWTLQLHLVSKLRGDFWNSNNNLSFKEAFWKYLRSRSSLFVHIAELKLLLTSWLHIPSLQNWAALEFFSQWQISQTSFMLNLRLFYPKTDRFKRLSLSPPSRGHVFADFWSCGSCKIETWHTTWTPVRFNL